MHSLPRLTATIQRRMCGRWCRWRRRRRRQKSTAATPRPRLYALDTHFILYLRLRLGTNEAILRFALGRRLTPVPTMPSLPPRDGVDAPPCAGIRAGASTVSTYATLNSVVGPSLPSRSKAPAPCSQFWRGAVVYATDLLGYTNYGSI